MFEMGLFFVVYFNLDGLWTLQDTPVFASRYEPETLWLPTDMSNYVCVNFVKALEDSNAVLMLVWLLYPLSYLSSLFLTSSLNSFKLLGFF